MTTGLVALNATRIATVVKAPVASAVVTGGGVVLPPPEKIVVVIVSPGLKPVPVTTTALPLGPLDGVIVKGAPEAVASGAADVSGAANSAGRLPRSSAAVSVNAAKLLRSEFKVPSSSER